jgi:glutathione S-transferase
VVAPLVFQKPRDKGALARVVAEDLPQVLDYLERQAPADGFLFDTVSIADIAIAVHFRNLAYARVQPDASRWPRTLGWVTRTLSEPAVAKVTALGDKLMTVPVEQTRIALAEMGVSLTRESVASLAPRRGPMSM